MQDRTRKKLQNRLRRIEGQLAGIQKMMDEERYCVDILNQIAAVRSALDAMGVELLTGHLQTCIVGHGGPDQHECARPLNQDQLMDEVRVVLARFLK